MRFAPLRVVARLVAPVETSIEIHLDGLLAAAWMLRQHGGDPGCLQASRATPIADLREPVLPVPRLVVLGRQVWAASAAWYDDNAEIGATHLTRRRDSEDVARLSRPYNPAFGPGRDRLIRSQTVLCSEVAWRCLGHAREMRHLLGLISSIGTRRRHGQGRVREWIVEPSGDGMRWLCNRGILARTIPAAWLVDGASTTLGAVEAPYWHPGRQEQIGRPGDPAALRPEVIEAARALVEACLSSAP
jgi:CRISPR type IV-associated protein Csf3